GAQQPGMTGQVKEDILSRIGELGVKMKGGKLVFQPNLLHKNEFLQNETPANFILVNGSTKKLMLEKNSLAFTICQVPVIYKMADADQLEVLFTDGKTELLNTSVLSREISNTIFRRTNEIAQIKVYINKEVLR
ncbi:MAG: hypothetical protein WAR80_15255, partial [Ferruginibacter sp.]